jgi:hypothetical protein
MRASVEYEKVEDAIQDLRDYRLTNNTAVLQPFSAAVEAFATRVAWCVVSSRWFPLSDEETGRARQPFRLISLQLVFHQESLVAPLPPFAQSTPARRSSS